MGLRAQMLQSECYSGPEALTCGSLDPRPFTLSPIASELSCKETVCDEVRTLRRLNLLPSILEALDEGLGLRDLGFRF